MLDRIAPIVWVMTTMLAMSPAALATDGHPENHQHEAGFVQVSNRPGATTLVAGPTPTMISNPQLRALGFSDELLNSTLWMVPASGNPIERWGTFSNWLSLVLANVEAKKFRQPVKRIEPLSLRGGQDQGVGVVFLAQTVVILFRVDSGDAVPAWIGSPDKLEPVRNHSEQHSAARVMRLLAYPQ